MTISAETLLTPANGTMGDLAAELQRRVSQLSSTAALAALNRALAWISRQGSFTFELTTSPPISTDLLADGPGLIGLDGVYATGELPEDLDTGKAMFVANAPSGIVIHKAGIQDLWQTYARNIPAGMGFDTYTIQGRNLILRPGQSGVTAVGLWYHRLFTPLLTSDYPRVPAGFLPLIVDLAESEEKRIYDVGTDWPAIFARSQDQIKVMLDGYRSVSMEEMTETDAQTAAVEKSQLGRA